MSEPTDRAMSDLSDEAFDKFVCASNNFEVPFFGGRLGWAKMGWNECRRRAEAMLEQERRKAFEAGWRDREKQISGTYPIREMAYRAFQAQLEGKE
jgi:hypothetical protein